MTDWMANQMDDVAGFDWYEGCVDAEDFMAADRAKQQVNMLHIAHVWTDRLNQGEVWTDARNRTTPIREMEPTHRQNVLGWLRRHAGEIKYLTLHLATAGKPPPTTPRATAESDAYEWITDTVLWRALINAQVAHLTTFDAVTRAAE